MLPTFIMGPRLNLDAIHNATEVSGSSTRNNAQACRNANGKIAPNQPGPHKARFYPAMALGGREAFAPQDLPALLVTLDLVS